MNIYEHVAKIIENMKMSTTYGGPDVQMFLTSCEPGYDLLEQVLAESGLKLIQVGNVCRVTDI